MTDEDGDQPGKRTHPPSEGVRIIGAEVTPSCCA